MIEMNVAGIALDATTRVPIVLLKDSTERRALPIWIGQNEARAILSVLIIHSLQDNTFFAVLTLKQGEATHQMDARPSDAIALALRLNCPIWVMEEVVADASIPVDQEADEAERQAFRSFVDNLSPEDFLKSRGDGETSNR
jgi:uncharacterized protein